MIASAMRRVSVHYLAQKLDFIASGFRIAAGRFDYLQRSMAASTVRSEVSKRVRSKYK